MNGKASYLHQTMQLEQFQKEALLHFDICLLSSLLAYSLFTYLAKIIHKKMHKNWTFRQSLLFVHCISSWFTVFFYRLFIAEKFKFFGRQPCFGTHCRNFSYLSLFSLITLCDSFLLKAYVFDIRNSAYLHRLPGQSDVISCVNFCPQTPMVFISFSS